MVDFKKRNHQILEAIIIAYSETGTPIGSEFLGQRFGLGVSSATIRNVMAELEEQGLVTHPHTSAGRIPTDHGYRYYVDLLMERKRLYPEEEVLIDQLAEMPPDDPLEVLQEAAKLLSDLTQRAGVALVPQLSHGSFKHLELIPIGPETAVAVVISEEGLVKHARLDFQISLSPVELDELARYLNAELQGMSLEQAHEHLDQIMQRWKQAIDLDRLEGLFQEPAAVILEGTRWILEAPEFQDIEKTHRLIRGLENRNELAGILQRDLAADEVKLHIGSENRGTSLVDCTIAGAPYRLRGGVMGTIGVVGSTRMDYPKVTALVSRMARMLSNVFRDW